MTSTINSVNGVINEVKVLYGATVNYWGDVHTLADAPAEDDLQIDIVDVLQGLANYEFNLFEFVSEVCDDNNADFNGDYDDAIDLLLNYGVIESDDYKGDNSYNWSSPVNHDFDYEIYKTFDGGILVTLSVHRFGDVRGNYTDTCLLKFDREDVFYDVLSDCNRNFVIDVDGSHYEIYVNVFSDTFEVFDEDNEYIFDVYGDDLENVKQEIREKIA